MPYIAIALVVAMALGGAVSLMARGALPGDALWSYKTTVSEGLAEALAPGDAAKAEQDITAMSARLDEAATLAQSGRIDSAAWSADAANFDSHARAAASHIANLEQSGGASDAARLSGQFQAALAVHLSSLSEISSQRPAAQSAMAPLLSGVRGALASAAELSQQ